MTKNKLRRKTIPSSLIHILDDESKTEVKTSPSKDFKQKPSLKLNQEDGSSLVIHQDAKDKAHDGLVFGTLLWEKKYCVVMPILKCNIIELE
jgi:hypothetical protein